MAISGIVGFTFEAAYEHGAPFPFAPLIAAALATLVDVLLAIPALRIRGVNLAVLTLPASVAVEQLIFQNETITSGEAGAKPPDYDGNHQEVPDGWLASASGSRMRRRSARRHCSVSR
jgi:branched-chain amino acid transport system permease protein